MSSTTGIEWTDATWNPTTGCTKVSAGCKHCYAERVFPRAYSKQWYSGSTPEDGRPRRFTDIFLHNDRLEQPLRWRRPKRIFVNSMSDLFHEQVPSEFIAQCLETMQSCPHHIFQILTKRPARMVEEMRTFFESWFVRFPNGVLPNVWLGVSVEDQKTADERIPLLLQTPAAIRFLSVEPLLGAADLNRACWGEGQLRPALEVQARQSVHPLSAIDWVIVGGESGPGARPMHPAWARSIRDQCVAAGVPFFFKQWGEWLTEAGIGPDGPPHVKIKPAWMREDGAVCEDVLPHSADATAATTSRHTWMKCARVGKKAAGRLLDGRTWDEMPRP